VFWCDGGRWIVCVHQAAKRAKMPLPVPMSMVSLHGRDTHEPSSVVKRRAI
jgi:hypothetical protein